MRRKSLERWRRCCLIREALADLVVLTINTALGPVLERLAAVEARVATLGDLRDRVVVVETKAAVPPRLEATPDPDLTAVLERVAAAEARLSTLGDLRDRVVTVETKALQPAPADPAIDTLEARVTLVLERLAAAELRLELKTAETAPLVASLAELTKENGGLRERIAVLETRAPVRARRVTKASTASTGRTAPTGSGSRTWPWSSTAIAPSR